MGRGLAWPCAVRFGTQVRRKAARAPAVRVVAVPMFPREEKCVGTKQRARGPKRVSPDNLSGVGLADRYHRFRLTRWSLSSQISNSTSIFTAWVFDTSQPSFAVLGTSGRFARAFEVRFRRIQKPR